MLEKMYKPVLVVAVVVLAILVVAMGLLQNADAACSPGDQCWYDYMTPTVSAYPPPATTPTTSWCGGYPGPEVWCYDMMDVHPTATMNELPWLTQAQGVDISWVGYANPGTQIVQYDVQWKFNDGPWEYFASYPPSVTADTFEFPVEGWYEFEVRAWDSNGEVEPFRDMAEARTYGDIEAPFYEVRAVLPYVSRP